MKLKCYITSLLLRALFQLYPTSPQSRLSTIEGIYSIFISSQCISHKLNNTSFQCDYLFGGSLIPLTLPQPDHNSLL